MPARSAIPTEWNARATYLQAHPQITAAAYPWTRAEIRAAAQVAGDTGDTAQAILQSWFTDMLSPWPDPPE